MKRCNSIRACRPARDSRTRFSNRAVALLVAATASLYAAAPPAPVSSAQAARPQTVAQDPGVPSGYRIGAGDVLEINVWKEPEASVLSVVVRPDGRVSLPLIKEIEVLGQTPAELEKTLTAKLARLINGADVTVVVKEVHSRKVYLIGAVKKEGSIPLLSNMTVLQVLAEAGGLTDYAKRKNIYVMRTVNGKQVKFPFNYNAVIKGEHVEQNIALLPDDTIVVPH
jgi:polysaccharide export outer membrane protein